MHLVKEFYANIGGRLDDKVFVLDVSSVVINNLIGALEHEEDDYLGTNGGRIRHKWAGEELCQSDKKVIWATGKSNQSLNFNGGALQPTWTPLIELICSRFIPTTYNSHITLDRSILMYDWEKREYMCKTQFWVRVYPLVFFPRLG